MRNLLLGQDNPCPVSVGSRMAGIEFHGDALLWVVQYHCRVVMAIKVTSMRVQLFPLFATVPVGSSSETT
jgi:hypothetical protein